MTSFAITGFSSVARTLTGSESGIIPTPNDALVVSGNDAITANNSVGIYPNSVIVNGSLIADSPFSTINAVDHAGVSLNLQIGASGFVSAGGAAVFSQLTGNFDLNNSGTIQSATTFGLNVGETDGGAAIRIANSGTIIGVSGATLNSGLTAQYVTNSGTIIGRTGIGLVLNALSGETGTSYLNNTGSISGGSHSLWGGDAPLVVSNSGILGGNVFMSTSADRY